MLVRSLYASRPSAALVPSSFDDILAKSRTNNPRLGVTGLLCVSEGLCIQVREGGRDEVNDLYNKIVMDERHQQVRLLVYEEIRERRFGNWTMGQVNIAKINPSLLLKYFRRVELDPFDCSGQSTLALLAELVDTASILSRSE